MNRYKILSLITLALLLSSTINPFPLTTTVSAATLTEVNVIYTDTVAPVISLNGSSNMTLEVGKSTYNEAGATVTDNSGEKITPTITGTVNTKKVGVYLVTYNATDSSGNKASAVMRVVIVLPSIK